MSSAPMILSPGLTWTNAGTRKPGKSRNGPQIIERLNSYTEIPIWPGRSHHHQGDYPRWGQKRGKIEIYSQGHYFTMTGAHLEGTATTIEDRQPELEIFHHEIFDKPKGTPRDIGPSPILDLSDHELVERAQQAASGEKFRSYGRGNGVNTPHILRPTLLCAPCWLSGPARTRARMNRLFRQSGG